MNETINKYALNDPMTWLKSLVGFVLVSLLIGIAPVSYQVAKDNYAPTDTWFVYCDVAPIYEATPQTSPITFVSTYRINEPVRMSWVDELYCKDELGTYVFHSSYKSESMRAETTHGKRAQSQWIYHGKVPDYETTCRMKSTICADRRYSQSKCQVLEGRPFKIAADGENYDK
jgi:hypothetical protein